MIYKNYIPNPKLSNYIKCYWSLENSDTSNISKEKIFPDGCMELIFHFGDLFKKHKQNNFSEIQPKSFIHGQLKEYIEIEPTGKTGIFSARFYPTGLKPFVDFDISEIAGQNINIYDIWKNDGKILENKILNSKNDEQRINILEFFLLEKLFKFQENNKIVDLCVNTIIKSNGNVTIDKLAYDLNIGKRHLERRFISSVGLSPKMLSRIIRFQNILNMIEHKQFSSLTMIAYEGGFYDQAHFIRDFKEFTGLNPKQYFSENLALIKYFNLE